MLDLDAHLDLDTPLWGLDGEQLVVVPTHFLGELQFGRVQRVRVKGPRTRFQPSAPRLRREID